METNLLVKMATNNNTLVLLFSLQDHPQIENFLQKVDTL